jgi:hypothetical protein
VPQGDATLEGTDIIGEHVVLTYQRNAANELEVHHLAGKLVRKGRDAAPRHLGRLLRVHSFTEPQVTYETSITTGKVKLTRVKLLIDTSRMTTEQARYSAAAIVAGRRSTATPVTAQRSWRYTT